MPASAPRATACLLAGLLLLSACGKPQQGPGGPAGPGGPPPAPPVSVSPVLERQVVQWDEYTGRIEAVKSVEVRARVSGYLESIHFKEGAEVKKGDLLFVIDPRPFEAAAERAKAESGRARAEVDAARSQLERARGDLARADKLAGTRAMSKEEYDARAAAVSSAEAGLKAAQAAQATAEAALKSALLDLAFTRVSAPVAGRVSRALVTEGNLVQANTTTLTGLVSLDPVYVYFDADEQNLLKYIRLSRNGERKSARMGRTPVEVALSDEAGYPHKGIIDFVDNRVDATTGTIRARATLANEDRVMTPGMFARVRIPGTGEFKAALVTDRAVMTDQSNKYLLVVNAEGVAEYRRVTLGAVVDGLRVIRGGVAAGEKVVVNGMQRVRPGSPVKAEVVPMPGTPEAQAAEEKAAGAAKPGAAR